MIEIDSQMSQEELFKYREEVLKAKKMGKLEKQIDKFLTEQGVKYHRQFPVKIGKRAPKRYAASFWLQDKGIILDLYTEGADMTVYDVGRKVRLPHHKWAKIKFIAPIKADSLWRDVKKDLVTLIAM